MNKLCLDTSKDSDELLETFDSSATNPKIELNFQSSALKRDDHAVDD